MQNDKNQATKVSLGPLLIACAVIVGITIYPKAVVAADGNADHGVLMLLMWAMMAGLVRGVGFVPHSKVLRWFLSSTACYIACLLGLSLKEISMYYPS